MPSHGKTLGSPSILRQISTTLAALVAICIATGDALARRSGRVEQRSHHAFTGKGAPRAPSRALRPFRSTNAGDLYRLAGLDDVVDVRLVGYRNRSLSVRALRQNVRHNVIALSKQGHIAGVQRVAAARSAKLRRDHGLLLVKRRGRRLPGSRPVAPSSLASSRCPVFYSAGSPWNTPIAAHPTIDVNNTGYMASLTASGSYIGSDPTEYTMPLYTIDSNTPYQLVALSGGYSNVTSSSSIAHSSGVTVRVPVPINAQPAEGSDGQIVVWNPSTGDEWGFWIFSNSGGQMSATNGYHYNTLWSGVPPSGFGSRGAGVPYLTGLVRTCEIAQGHIDHAIAFAYQSPSPNQVYPATKSDGNVIGGMPEGTHLQLDPSIPDSTIENSWGCTGPCFITAKALQKYGMFLIDHAGHPKVYFEYDGTAHWGGTVTASTTRPIPISAFRVVDG